MSDNVIVGQSVKYFSNFLFAIGPGIKFRLIVEKLPVADFHN